MGLSQLERFTGVSRNAVKRSLDRLIEQGWIKMVEEYERSRVTRKWKVKRIEATTAPFLTESKMNTVQNEQSPNQTLLVSKMDPVPGSKMDTYRESINKENTKNSLFRIPSA